MKTFNILPLAIIILFANFTYSQQLDVNFGNNGVAVFNSLYTDNGNALAIDKDGKIILVGESGFNEGLVIRLNTDGSPDNTFGVYTGIFDNSPVGSVGATVDFCEIYLRDVKIDKNNKIVVAGYCLWDTNEFDGIVFRLNTDGSLDNTFNGVGYIRLASPSNIDRIYSIAIDDNNNVYAHILKTFQDFNDFYSQTNESSIVKINNNGTIDASFGNSGTVSFYSVASKDSAPMKIIYYDNKLYVSTHHYSSRKIYSHPSAESLACLNLNGSIDISFGINGFLDEPNLNFNQLKINNNFIYTNKGRYYLNGTKDLLYGVSGAREDNFNILASNPYLGKYGAIDFDIYGNLYFFGKTGSPIGYYDIIGFSKNKTNGMLDTDFGTTGIIKTDIDPGNSHKAIDAAITSNGYIYVLSHFFTGLDPDYANNNYNWHNDICVARYTFTPVADIKTELKYQSSLIYPNPSNGKFYIKDNSDDPIKEIIITNSIGQKEFHRDLSNIETTFKGQLFIELKSETNTYYQKILIFE